MDRRTLLRRIGTAALVGIAGCGSTDPGTPTDPGTTAADRGTTVTTGTGTPGVTTDAGPTRTTSDRTTAGSPITELPGPRTDPGGCLAGSPCSPDATLDAGDRSVRIASVHRGVGYRHLTFPDAQGVHAPGDRGFVVLGVEPADGGTDGGELPPPDAFELVAGDRRFAAGLDESNPYGVGTPAGNRRYEPGRRPNGWVGVPVPTPFDGDGLAVTTSETDDRVPLPPGLVESLRDPPVFDLVGFHVPDEVAPVGRVAVEFVVANVGGSDGVCPAVVNHSHPYAFQVADVAVPTGEFRRRRVDVTTAPREAGRTVHVSFRSASGAREREVEVVE